VLTLTALGQWFELRDGATAILSSDGQLYLHDAHSLSSLQGLVDPKVPPGYPIFLAGIFLVAGRDNLLAVLVVQSLLLIAALIELYAFLVVASVPRWLAMAVAACLGVSAWLAQWERYVLTEALSFWLVATLLLLTARWIRRPSTGVAVACGLVGAAIPLVRPALGAVPATVLIVLLARWALSRAPGGARLPATALLLFLVISYLPVGAYVTANAVVNDCYCYTSISNLNLFGKLYEYHMQELTADPQFATIAGQIQVSTDINQFLSAHPGYEAENYTPLGDFARSQMLRYREYTARRTVSEVRRVLTLEITRAVFANPVFACRGGSAPPDTLETGDAIAQSGLSPCVATNLSVGTYGEVTNTLVYVLVVLGYAALPGGFLLGALLVLRRPTRDRTWLLLLATTVAGVVVSTSAVGGYESFERLKLPADGASLAALALFLTETAWLLRRLTSSVGPAPASTRAGNLRD